MDIKKISPYLPGHMFLLDFDSRIIFCNREQAKFFGYKSEADLAGLTLADLADESTPKEALDAVRKNDLQVLNSEQSLLSEEFCLDKSGQERIFLSRKAPFYDTEGRVMGLLGSAFEISELKKMEKKLFSLKQSLQVSLSTKEAFIANMSHDIRTPLTGILHLSKLIEKEANNPDVVKYAQLLTTSAYDLLIFSNQFMSYIVLTYRLMTPRQIGFSPAQMIQTIANQASDFINKKNLEYRVSFDEGCPDIIYADLECLYLACACLVTNAVRFTFAGYVKVGLNLLQEDKQSMLVVEVKDTGIGIDPTIHEKIFEEFSKASPSFKDNTNHVGLGLSMVKKIVDSKGGRVSVSSREGHGARFVIHYPVKLVSQDKIVSDFTDYTHLIGVKTQFDLLAEDILTYQKKGRGKLHFKQVFKILLVDDNHLVLAATKSILLDICSSFEIHTVDTGFGALDALENNYFNLCFFDISLPDIGGIALIEKWREYEMAQSLQYTPVIALTGRVDLGVPGPLIQGGFVDILNKPLERDVAYELLKKYLPDFVPV